MDSGGSELVGWCGASDGNVLFGLLSQFKQPPDGHELTECGWVVQ